MAILDLGKVVFKGVGHAMRKGPNIKLDVRVAPAEGPGVPPGTFVWSVLEKDLSDNSEDIIVGGAAPDATQAAVLGAMALMTELQRRRS